MWENTHRKRVILNIVLSVLILIALGVLGYFFLQVRQQTQAHDEELSELYLQQQKQQTEVRQESVANIQAEYEKDMATVAEYLPGIVCWGDSLTLGSAGNISYPSVLKLYLDTYFCDIYDFRSTVENAEDFARLKWEDYKVSVPVVNMGAGQEDSYTVLGRSGAVPYVLGKNVTIPAECEPVEVTLKVDGKTATPLTGGDGGVNNVHINGIEGTLSMEHHPYSGTPYRYYFTRIEAGEAVDAPAGTEVVTAASDLYRDYIHIVCIGTFGSYKNGKDLAQQVKDLLARQTKNTDRYLVLGLCSYNGSTAWASNMDTIDADMMQAFGNHYVNVRKYLVEDGLRDAGLTATKEDTQRVVDGRVPLSFTTSRSSVELNGTAYTLLGKLLYTRMESLGYFDEVYEELGIKETTKTILKEDPTYFERMITNSLK